MKEHTVRHDVSLAYIRSLETEQPIKRHDGAFDLVWLWMKHSGCEAEKSSSPKKEKRNNYLRCISSMFFFLLCLVQQPYKSLLCPQVKMISPFLSYHTMKKPFMETYCIDQIYWYHILIWPFKGSNFPFSFLAHFHLLKLDLHTPTPRTPSPPPCGKCRAGWW